jgi:hypothetical protein
MTVNLTNTWKQHAFPDDAPGREERWSLESERRRVADRTDFDLEQSGFTNKIHRFTSGQNDDLNGQAAKKKAADDMMMFLAVGSPAYMEAYNNKLTFQIGDEDVEITQGQLHDLSKRRAEDLQLQIDAAKRRGASADEIARMQDNLNAYVIIRDNADPRLGPATPERHEAINAAIAGNADAQETLRREGTILGEPTVKQSESAPRMDVASQIVSVTQGRTNAEGRASFAATIDDPVSQRTVMSLAKEFEIAKAREAPRDVESADRPEPMSPDRVTGISI